MPEDPNYEKDGCFRQYSDGTLRGTFVEDGLRGGHRFGLIASSDHGNGASYVGAYATDLSRASVFEALRARRTIAATTRDLVVDFRLNDAFMGTIAPPSTVATVSGYARAYGEIARVDLVRDGEIARRWATEPELEPGWISVALRVEWSVGDLAFSDWGGDLVISGGAVLETPYWSPEITEVAPNRVAWRSAIRNFHSQYGAQRGGIELTVTGPPEAIVTVTTAPVVAAATLGAIAVAFSDRASGAPAVARQLELGRADAGTLSLRPGTGGFVGLGTDEIRVEFSEPVRAPSWYYLRVILTDGEMAWSSPIWVAPPGAQG